MFEHTLLNYLSVKLYLFIYFYLLVDIIYQNKVLKLANISDIFYDECLIDKCFFFLLRKIKIYIDYAI